MVTVFIDGFFDVSMLCVAVLKVVQKSQVSPSLSSTPFPSLVSPPSPLTLLLLPSLFWPLSPPLPSLPSRPYKFRYGVWGNAVSSPSRVWVGAPAEMEFDAFEP